MLGDDGQTAAYDSTVTEALVDEWAASGLRVLSFAMRRFDELPDKLPAEEIESGLTLIGLTGLVDPPRPEAAGAVSTCKTAGIVPVMITGDHPATALAIAQRLGIAESADEMMTGPELEALSLEHFERRVEDVRVYARVAPEQKLKIVQALQDKGEFVAMTGDGVNDAPALSRADIGVAMGITGTDVAKEAADMVLLDDNFASIVGSVREGRRIFDNIRKFIKYTMTSNAGEIWTILLAPLLGMPVPLLPIHILWINLVTDGLPGLAMAAEPHERAIMKRPPRPPKESIFADGLAVHLMWVGLLMGAASLVTQAGAMALDNPRWQTMVFSVLCFSQMGHALAVRSDRDSLFRQGLLSNRPLFGAVLLTVVLQLATIYVPFLQPVFRTEALTAVELAIVIAASSVVFIAVEIEKWYKRRCDERDGCAVE
jgi:Ca2+-transporting ATPase